MKYFIGYAWIEKGQKACWKPIREVTKIYKRGRNSGKIVVLLTNGRSKKIKSGQLRMLKNCPDCHSELKREDYKIQCEKCGWPNDGNPDSNIFDES